MKTKNEDASPLDGEKIITPLKGVIFSPFQGVENSQSRQGAKRTIELLKRKNTYTPELQTPKNELVRGKDGIVRGNLNGIECEIFEGESNREGAIKGVKYDFVRFHNHPSFDNYGNYIGKNKICNE